MSRLTHAEIKDKTERKIPHERWQRSLFRARRIRRMYLDSQDRNLDALMIGMYIQMYERGDRTPWLLHKLEAVS